MTNTKSTKRALLASVMAMLLCFTMLLGTTFAWFTDTATASVNKIQSGTLDIELQMKNASGEWVNAEGATLDFKKASAIYGTDVLWEPGCTYELPAIRVVNKGSLNAKIMILLGGITGSEKLFEVIDFTTTLSESPVEKYNGVKWNALWGGDDYTNEAGESGQVAETCVLADWSLAASEKTVVMEGGVTNTDTTPVFTISAHMDEDAGNEYQDLSIEGISIVVVATQMGGEFDSYNNYYDQDAPYPIIVSTGEELATALENANPGDVITLSSGVKYGKVTLGEMKDVVINGADGASVIIATDANTKIENVTLQEIDFSYDATTADFGVVINSNAQIDNLVIDGCTFIGTGAKAGRGLSGNNNNASIVLKNCTFEDLGYPIYAWGGYSSLEIDSCTFDNIKSWAIMPQSGFDGDFTVTNCKFVDCIGGGLIKAGTLTAGHTFTFTDNTITNCTVAGDHNWFQFNATAGTVVVSNNMKDGVAWTPAAEDGLKY